MVQDKNTAITIRLPNQLRKQIKGAAGETDQSMNSWIIQAIQEKLAKQKQ